MFSFEDEIKKHGGFNQFILVSYLYYSAARQNSTLHLHTLSVDKIADFLCYFVIKNFIRTKPDGAIVWFVSKLNVTYFLNMRTFLQVYIK